MNLEILLSSPPIGPNIGIAIVGVMILLGIGYVLVSTDSEGWTYESLSEDEQMVVDLLRDNNGRVNQKQISDDLEYSDAKTSRITSSLIEMNVVTKSREDRQNYIILNTDGEES